MPKQMLYCPTCMTVADHLVERLPEGDVAWCQRCRRIHVVTEPEVPRPERPPSEDR